MIRPIERNSWNVKQMSVKKNWTLATNDVQNVWQLYTKTWHKGLQATQVNSAFWRPWKLEVHSLLVFLIQYIFLYMCGTCVIPWIVNLEIHIWYARTNIEFKWDLIPGFPILYITIVDQNFFISGLLPARHFAICDTHHAEGRVDPKVDEGQNGFRFWIPQSM
jgi:hypothetical protein